MDWNLEFEVPVNGRFRKATVTAVNDNGTVLHRAKLDMDVASERRKLVRDLAKRTGDDGAVVESKVEETWNSAVGDRRQQEQEAPRDVRPEHADQVTVEVLDLAPNRIDRPLRLQGDRAYAGTWLHVQTTVRQTMDPKTGKVETFDPPKVVIEPALVIVRDDGAVFGDGALPLGGVRPLAELGLTVALATQPPPGQAWSGAGVKRYLARVRPDPAEVFGRVAGVVDHFMDFKRSLAPQETMCRMVACYVLATWLLDAFNVVGYLWSHGDRGAGKTNLLFVVAEMSYLGQVILAGGSYASLRDLADYGASLAFDDVEGIMDLKKADPDKRALLLSGNRRGSTVTFKEPAGERGWVLRHVNAFCPRQFSATRLPDEILASRSIITPLVRSGDAERAKRNPLDHDSWPCERRRLVDDLWALGLTNLATVKPYDTKAAERSDLAGRDLEPWRAIFAVALWLEEQHQVEGLFDEMKRLATSYQAERGDLEAHDLTRLAILALWQMAQGEEDAFEFKTADLKDGINRLAAEEDLATGDEPFTNTKRVGWLLRRLRFEKGAKGKNARTWKTSPEDVLAVARSYGMRLETVPVTGDIPLDADEIPFD